MTHPTPEPTPAAPQRRRVRARWTLVVVSAIAAVGTLEVGLRLTNLAPPDPYGWVGQHPDRTSFAFESDPLLGWRMRPGHTFEWTLDGTAVAYHADDAGFRHDPAAPPEPAARRIAIVGDFNAFGFGVPLAASFGGILDVELPGVDVANLALPGYGVDQIWQCLREIALPTRPDLVVVGLVRDDFHRSLRAYRHTEGFNKPTFTLDGGALRQCTSDGRPNWLVAALEAHSHVWTAGKRLLQRLGYRYGIGTWWTLNRALLDAMRADAARQGVPLLFVHLPEPGEGEWPSLSEYMAATGAAFVSPLDTPPPDEPRFFSDRHLNRAGHRWVAAAVRDWLRGHF